jgi:type II secretory ATPase GspE/PulE/Tfp pilus assembly ATPase PilB-like protein
VNTRRDEDQAMYDAGIDFRPAAPRLAPSNEKPVEARPLRREALGAALKRRENMPVVRLGEALLQMNFITAAQLDEALAHQRVHRKAPLGQILVKTGAITEQQLKQALAEKLGIPFIDLDAFAIERDATQRLPLEIARKYGALPLCMESGALVVAMSDPLNAAAIEALRFHAQTRIAPVMAAPDAIAKAIKRSYTTGIDAWTPPAAFEHPLQSFLAPDKTGGGDNMEGSSNSATPPAGAASPRTARGGDSVADHLNQIMREASARDAAGIHIENQSGTRDTCVRLRENGVLRDHLHLSAALGGGLTTRIKSLAGLDIAEIRRAQEGKLLFPLPGSPALELRVTTLPTAHGLEDLVMQRLSPLTPRALDGIGLPDALLAQLQHLAARRSGAILICGPAGSGKTTTLHALLQAINSRERKICTVEDPIEMAQPGLRQIEVNTDAGWNSAAILRALRRGDTDVIAAGALHDLETVQQLLNAALAGRLVIGVLDADNAAHGVASLLDRGADGDRIADALLGVVAQRMARRVCGHCGVSEPARDEELHALAHTYCGGSDDAAAAVIETWSARHPGGIRLRRARGCEQCGNTGYADRVALFELLTADQDLRGAMRRNAGAAALSRAAREHGMGALLRHGIDMVIGGVTDMREVRAVCG